MTKREYYFAEIICFGATCSEGKCPCFQKGACRFYTLPPKTMAMIARKRFEEKGRPEKLKDAMDAINKDCPAKAVIL